ncbi:MAG: ABC transporter substrate-binding protein [Alphaproteobacteria bacterium]
MICRFLAAAALAAGLVFPRPASAEANVVRVAKQFGVGYMQYMVMQELKLVEKHAKAAGLDITTEWATFRSSDVMNDALISGSVDFVSLGIPGMITINSKTRGTANEVKGVLGLNISPLMLVVRDPAIKLLKDFKENHRIALPAVKVSNQAIILQMAAAKEFGDAKWGALDHLTVSMSHPDATAAMLGGQSEITANFSSAPFQYRQLKNPNIKLLLNSADLFRDDPMSFNVVAATSKFKADNPKLFAAFVAAMKEATDVINADKRKGRGDLPQGVGREDDRRRHHGGAEGPGDPVQQPGRWYSRVRGLHGEDRHAEESTEGLEGHVLPGGAGGELDTVVCPGRRAA